MLTKQQQELVENLFELEPAATYAERAASSVANLVAASGFQLVLDGATVAASAQRGHAPSASFELSELPGGPNTLMLYGRALSEVDESLARWGARLLSRGLRYGLRVPPESGGVRRSEVRTRLEDMPLTPRERDVVGQLVSGASTRQIAAYTGLTVSTINTYVKRVFAKLGVHSRVALIAMVAGTRGVFDPQP